MTAGCAERTLHLEGGHEWRSSKIGLGNRFYLVSPLMNLVQIVAVHSLMKPELGGIVDIKEEQNI